MLEFAEALFGGIDRDVSGRKSASRLVTLPAVATTTVPKATDCGTGQNLLLFKEMYHLLFLFYG